eukprot:6219663-Amphidinium_carterae.1
MLSGVGHVGYMRTRQGKLLVRCTSAQIAQIRHRVLPDDVRFKLSPSLVIKYRWKISNVPVSVSAQRLSDALASGHGWHQVSLRQQHPPKKGYTWTVQLGSDAFPPFDSALVEDKLCVITQINPPQSSPALVDSEWLSSPASSTIAQPKPLS